MLAEVITSATVTIINTTIRKTLNRKKGACIININIIDIMNSELSYLYLIHKRKRLITRQGQKTSIAKSTY